MNKTNINNGQLREFVEEIVMHKLYEAELEKISGGKKESHCPKNI